MNRLMKMASAVAGAATLAGAGALATVQPAQAAARPAACTASQLRITARDPQGAGGSEEITLAFVNTSRRACTMIGYPGVAGVDARGRQVIQARRTTSGMLHYRRVPVHAVVVQPGRSVTATLEYIGTPHQDWHAVDVRSFLVTPPNTRTSVRVTLPAPLKSIALYPDFQVHPVN